MQVINNSNLVLDNIYICQLGDKQTCQLRVRIYKELKLIFSGVIRLTLSIILKLRLVGFFLIHIGSISKALNGNSDYHCF